MKSKNIEMTKRQTTGEGYGEAEMCQEMVEAISRLNMEQQKSRLDHRNEISRLKQDHEDTKRLLETDYRTQLDREKAKNLTLEEYQIVYRKRISRLE